MDLLLIQKTSLTDTQLGFFAATALSVLVFSAIDKEKEKQRWRKFWVIFFSIWLSIMVVGGIICGILLLTLPIFNFGIFSNFLNGMFDFMGWALLLGGLAMIYPAILTWKKLRKFKAKAPPQ
jgi:hypothetical protein